MDFETRAIHDGQEPDPATGAIITPIYQTSTYVQEAVGVHKGYDYSRVANPTRTALQIALASLEDAEHGIAFCSGLGATTTLMHLVDPGERVVLIADVYGGVYRMTSQVYEPKGYRFTYVPAAEFDDDLGAHLDEDVRLVWVETPSNPLLNIVDIRRPPTPRTPPARCSSSTTRSPRRTSSSRSTLGADARRPLDDEVPRRPQRHGRRLRRDERRRARRAALLPAEVARRRARPVRRWLVLRGIKTLALRMRQHCENARQVAAFLDGHPAVEQRALPRPAVASRPRRSRARQMRDFGGMVSFLAGVRGGGGRARRAHEASSSSPSRSAASRA